jgi:hypothetical protein
MWKVDRPAHSARESYLQCTKRVKNVDLRHRLAGVVGDIDAASAKYERAASAAAIHTLDPNDFDLQGVSNEEMITVYESRMAKKGAPGRAIYDSLLLAPLLGRCPVCGVRQVSTLDHHVPKTRFTALAVDPLNLIACCAECNKVKANSLSSSPDTEAIHPYFDAIDGDQWLRATLIEESPASLGFYVDPPSTWDSTLVDRVNNHFNRFALAPLYAVQAAQELASTRHYLSGLLIDAGRGAVQNHLERMAASCRHDALNNWKTAMYEAVSTSDWYCAGGFKVDPTGDT